LCSGGRGGNCRAGFINIRLSFRGQAETVRSILAQALRTVANRRIAKQK
jgi:hypothetical protein